jgi:hypothetical protein
MALTQVQVGVGGNSNAPAFSAYVSNNTNFTLASWTKVIFDVEEFDTNNNFSSSRFTPTVAGYYQISGAVTLFNSAVLMVTARVSIYKNGSFYKAVGINGGGSNAQINDCEQCVSSVVYLNGSTDYVELYCYSNATGGTPGYSGTAGRPDQTFFNGVMVRGA